MGKPGRPPSKATKIDRERAARLPGPDGPLGSKACARMAGEIAKQLATLLNRNWTDPDALTLRFLIVGYDKLAAPDRHGTIGGDWTTLAPDHPDAIALQQAAVPLPKGLDVSGIPARSRESVIPCANKKYECIVGRGKSGAPVYGKRSHRMEWQACASFIQLIRTTGLDTDPAIDGFCKYLVLRLRAGVPARGCLRLCANDKCLGADPARMTGPAFTTTAPDQWHCPTCRKDSATIAALRKRRQRKKD